MASLAPSLVPLLAPLSSPIDEAVYSDLAAAKAALLNRKCQQLRKLSRLWKKKKLMKLFPGLMKH
jgi:hypothetical protein